MSNLVGLLVVLILVPDLVKSLIPSLNDDVLGLIVFKADIQDPKGQLVSWNEDDDSPCNWIGVKCGPKSNRVSELILDGFSLSGRIGRGLLQLQFLRKLSLSKNNLTGNVNPGFAGLQNLHTMDLSENNLSGPIPDELFQQCGSLRTISLANNKFSGEIPASLSSCSTLVWVNFSSNQLSGSLPSSLWSLFGLRSIDLSDNLIEGTIPKGLERLNNLRAIKLKKNHLSGSIPYEIGSCLLFKTIDLSENTFSGSIPDSMQKLSLCNYLNLHKNLFEGQIPNWIGEMKNLETLDLSANRFYGQVPTSLGNLQSLKILKLSDNNLDGTLPQSMINCTNLQSLDFSKNSLMGNFPSWLFIPSLKIQDLDLSDNAFSGQITSSIGDLSSLQFLNLSKNSLMGTVPTSIGKLKALAVLDLSENQLNGIIPISLEDCSSLTSLLLSHNTLRGTIPTAITKLINLKTVDLSFNNLTGNLPKQLANLPHLISFDISHNNLEGELPSGSFFNTISPSSVSGNPSLCGSAVNKSCMAVLPKPIVLNPNSSSDSTPGSLPENLSHKRIVLSISALIAIGAAGLIFIGVITITVLNLRVRSLSTSRSPVALTFSGDDEFSNSPVTDSNSGKLVMFSGDPKFKTGAHALLTKDCELGRGGFGAVYKTVLRDGRPVAIKKLTVSCLVKSQEDFELEVKKLGKMRHPNLVQLEGYYWTPSLQLLISEFVSGGSLYKRIHEGLNGNFLSWNQRLNIILGTAKGLAHLHNHNIIDYNIKSSNVLIDSSGEPKLADFGLAKLLPMLDRYVLSSKIQSSLGYTAPEFACKNVKITEKFDIYGFGVLVLEIVTGKRPVEYMEDDVVVLHDMVRGALDESNVEDCVDEKLQGNFPADEAVPVMKLGLICTSQVPSNRPDMVEVVNILELIKCPSESN